MTNDGHISKLGLHGKAKSFLGEYGWFIGRNVDIQECANEIIKRGFKWNGFAESILRQFNGIAFTNNSGGVSWFAFGHKECFHTFRPDHLKILEALAGNTDPCPVGGGGGYLLFVFPNGRCALLHEQWLFLVLSDSFGEALDAMIFNDLSGCRLVDDIEAYRPDW